MFQQTIQLTKPPHCLVQGHAGRSVMEVLALSEWPLCGSLDVCPRRPCSGALGILQTLV